MSIHGSEFKAFISGPRELPTHSWNPAFKEKYKKFISSRRVAFCFRSLVSDSISLSELTQFDDLLYVVGPSNILFINRNKTVFQSVRFFQAGAKRQTVKQHSISVFHSIGLISTATRAYT